MKKSQLKKELASLSRKHNDYKMKIQSVIRDKYYPYKRQYVHLERENENLSTLNDALINFILNNGLGPRYYKTFIEEFYPHDALDFRNKNEVRIGALDQKNLLDKIKFEVSKNLN